MNRIFTLFSIGFLFCIFPITGIFATSVITQSTVFTADTTPVFQSMSDNPIIGLLIDVQGPGNDLSVTDISIDGSLCTNFSLDVALVKVFYTGNDSNFSVSTVYWSGQLNNPTVSGNQPLLPGKNYFWICYNIAISALAGDIVDAACNSFTINLTGGNYLPDISSPAGSRTINPYYVVPRNISGKIVYNNQAQTPLSNVIVLLTDGFVQQQVTTNNTGNYQFYNLSPSTYTIMVICTKPWGGSNAVDALNILLHFVGTAPLTGLSLLAADVDYNGYINSSDGLAVLRRFTGLTSSFIAGDWVFEPTQIVIDGTHNITHNIKGLCVGDVNRSYNP